MCIASCLGVRGSDTPRRAGLTADSARELVGEIRDKAAKAVRAARLLELTVGAGAVGQETMSSSCVWQPKARGRAGAQASTQLAEDFLRRHSLLGGRGRSAPPSSRRERRGSGSRPAPPGRRRAPPRRSPPRRPRAERCTGSARRSPPSATSSVWASQILTSIVPNRGCGRTSHHRKVGSGNASQLISRSTVSTHSA